MEPEPRRVLGRGPGRDRQFPLAFTSFWHFFVALGRLDRDLELFMSLDVGSSMLGVIAPGAGAIAVLLTQRSGPRPAVEREPEPSAMMVG